MVTHQSSVNFENLIKDLADMYPFDVGTVVLVEVVANALDSRATSISITFEPKRRTLVVTDNGTGMTASDFAQYHDFAAGLKTRGMGIGFAGVGAKISFNIASRVITETRSDSFVGGSSWYLESKKKLLWEEIKPVHLRSNGTRVEVMFRDDVDLPFASTENIVLLLKEHYLPLLDNDFLSLYEQLGYYPHNLRFIVNNQVIQPGNIALDYQLTNVHNFSPQSSRRRIGYGILGLAPIEYPMSENLCGVLLSTRGKIIKADMFNQFPSDIGPRILGLVEIPDFINFLTSAKTDFIKRKKFREFEKLYDPIRQEFKSWLSKLGIQSTESSSNDEILKLEREIRKLIDQIPEFSEFFGFRSPKNIPQQSDEGIPNATWQEGTQTTLPIGEGDSGGGEGPFDIGEETGEALQENVEEGKVTTQPISRTSHRGPKIGYSDAPDRIDLAWVDGTYVMINSSHPAFLKVCNNNQAKRLHEIFAIALAIQKFLFTGNLQDLTFSDRVMAAWGNSK